MRAWILVALLGVLAWLLLRKGSGTVDDSPDYTSTDTAPDASAESPSFFTDPLGAFARAIAGTEGKPGDLNYRNNNPGNLKYAGQPGATKGAAGFAVFDSYDAGYQALQRQIALDARRNPEWTLTQYMSKYLGGSPSAPAITGEGNPFTKALGVATALGVSINSTLGEILGAKNG